jgi:hypothetical protein
MSRPHFHFARRAALAVVLGVWMSAAAEAGEGPPLETAQLEIDLGAGRVRASTAQREVSFAVNGPEVRARLNALIDSFARGGDSLAERRALGHLLFTPLEPVLVEAPRWRVVVPAAASAPGALAPLAALVLPWDAGRLPVAAHHAVSFAWPGSLSPGGGSTPGEGNGGLLLVAPFERGIEPRADDPDTLRAALRAGVARLELLPRNEITPEAVRRALHDSAAPALWLRALAHQVDGLRPAFDALPALVVWSLPGRDPQARGGVNAQSFRGESRAPEAVIVQVWPGSEAGRSWCYRALADALARGLSAGEAVAELQRRAALDGATPAQWASFACVGSAETRVEIERAPWLRRVFAPR